MYDSLKSEREAYAPLWREAAKYVGISVEMDESNSGMVNKAKVADEFVDDPTAALSASQFADYMAGIMWGNGLNVFSLEPSDEVISLVGSPEVVRPYYHYITKRILHHMNHKDAGLMQALKAYLVDQVSLGTSGIGCFPNKKYLNGTAHNALKFKPFGVDQICIDEGDSGAVDYVFCDYYWRTARIVNEFCCDSGKEIDSAKVAKLPKEIRDAYEKGDLNRSFRLVMGVIPRTDFDPRLMGKKGTKYRGVWFFIGSKGPQEFFAEEDFAERPIAVARMVKMRNKIYGGCPGTMLLSTIRSANFMMGTTIDITEKMGSPSLGVFSNAIFGDSVLDTSPNGLTVFNSMMAGSSPPVFPVHDVGDPSGIIKVVLPFLNEKIISAFKIDALLDFSASKEMTATESLQRYAIRGKALSGMLIQQETECLVPVTDRSISVLDAMNELGVDAQIMEEEAVRLMSAGLAAQIIPDAVKQAKKEGKPWYKIRWNNELNKLTRTETIQSLTQMLQATMAVAQVRPQIISAVDWYEMLEKVEENLGTSVLIGKMKFREKLEQEAQMQAASMALQAGQIQAATAKDSALANKQNSEANAINARR